MKYEYLPLFIWKRISMPLFVAKYLFRLLAAVTRGFGKA
jgi:hypothetical protein